MIVEPAEWKRRVALTGCVLHSDPAECEGPLEGHHIVTSQALKKRGLHFLLYDVRNGMALCNKAHRRHTRAIERIPYELLTQDAIDFATEVGLDWQLDRYYPRRDDGEARPC